MKLLHFYTVVGSDTVYFSLSPSGCVGGPVGMIVPISQTGPKIDRVAWLHISDDGNTILAEGGDLGIIRPGTVRTGEDPLDSAKHPDTAILERIVELENSGKLRLFSEATNGSNNTLDGLRNFIRDFK